MEMEQGENEFSVFMRRSAPSQRDTDEIQSYFSNPDTSFSSLNAYPTIKKYSIATILSSQQVPQSSECSTFRLFSTTQNDAKFYRKFLNKMFY